MELELKHLAPYLPYELKCLTINAGLGEKTRATMVGIQRQMLYLKTDVATITRGFSEAKPILRPLSDLTKEIEQISIDYNKQFNVPAMRWGSIYIDLKTIASEDKDITKTLKYFLIENMSYWVMQELLKKHFDVFGLIEKGLAIDINTLENQ